MTPGAPRRGTLEPGTVAVAVEQLRRRVPGGVGRYAECLLGALADPGLGAPPLLLLASRWRGPGDDPLGRFPFARRPSRVPAPWLGLAWDVGLCPAPRAAAVVHAVSLAAPPSRQPLCVTVHDLAWRAVPEATTGRGRRWHEAALRRALRAAAAFVVPSAPVADSLVAAGAASARVHVIGHGADHLPPPDHAGAARLLARLGVGGDYLLTVGTLEPRKNLATLVAGYTRARPHLEGPWPLVVVGPRGWGRAGVGATPADGVVLAGGVDDAVLAALYAGARTFAYVPVSEGFGLPPVEAMVRGVPVVASTAVPSTTPPAAPPGVARLVDAASAEEVGDALVAVSTDEGLRGALRAAASSYVASCTWRDTAAAHVALWASLA